MLMPTDDVISTETESSQSQVHCGSGCANMVFDTSVDTFLTVGSCERTSDEDTDSVRKDDMLEDLEKSLLAGDFFCSVSPEMDSKQDVEQYVSASENCTDTIPLADPQVNTCKNNDFETDTAVNKCLPNFVDIDQCDSVNETCAEAVAFSDLEPYSCSVNVPETLSVPQGCILISVDVPDAEIESCVTGVEVELQNDKIDETSAVDKTDSDCIIVSETVPSSDLGPYSCSHKAPDTDSVPQGCLPISVDVPDAEIESCVSGMEVEIQNDKSGDTSAVEETDSDCVIDHVSGSEAYDCWPVESEGEMAVEILGCDHAYSLPAVSVQHSAVVTSSGVIHQKCTSQAGTNFSVHSLQAHDFNLSTVLPFPSLIADPNTNELCSYKHSHEHSTDNVSLLAVARVQQMDTEISGVSGLGDENGSFMLGNSSYPVVEIVPRYDEAEVDEIEQPYLSSQIPCSAADFTGLPAVAVAPSNNMSSDSTATSSSRRTKASVVTLV